MIQQQRAVLFARKKIDKKVALKVFFIYHAFQAVKERLKLGVKSQAIHQMNS